MELVSVVSPYFKKKLFIKKTVDSILNQTYSNFELIIIYDDTDQDDYKYIKKISKIDKRIKVIKNSKNLGAGESRNIGIKHSRGKYIAFLDSDDLWHSQKLEKQLRFMIDNNFDISHSSYTIINKKNKVIGKRIARNFLNYNSLLKSCDIGLSTVIIRKNLFNNGLKFPKLRTKEDFVLWLKLLRKNNKIMALNKTLVSWRKLDNSLSSSLLQRLYDGFKVYNKYMNYNYLKSLYLLSCLCLNFLKKK